MGATSKSTRVIRSQPAGSFKLLTGKLPPRKESKFRNLKRPYVPVAENAITRPAPRLAATQLNNYISLLFDNPIAVPVRPPTRKHPNPSPENFARTMKSDIQVLTSPTADTRGTSLLLCFDQQRYVFGQAPEGLQRAFAQNRIGLSKITDYFLSGTTCWDNFGGMTGFILTLAGVMQDSRTASLGKMQEALEKKENLLRSQQNPKTREKLEAEKQSLLEELANPTKNRPSLSIHGGSNILKTLATARKFIFRQGIPIHVNEYDSIDPSEPAFSKPTWSDDKIMVWAIPVSPASSNSPSATNSPLKRSFDEYLEQEGSKKAQERGESYTEEDSQRHKHQVLKAVVSDMFDSDWRLDALVEKSLDEVELPAALFVRNQQTGKTERYKGPLPGSDVKVPNIKVLVRRPWPGALVKKLPTTEPSPVSMSYVIRCRAQRGKFLPKKAIELHVKPGPSFQLLSSGEKVTAKDGSTVTPEQVMEPSRPGPGLFLADVPSPSYLPALLSSPFWDTADIIDEVKTVFWILGPGVVDDLSLQDFVKSKSGFKHIISSSDHSGNRLSFDSSAVATIRHHQIDPTRYDIPKHSNVRKPLPEALSKAVLAERGLNIQLTPTFAIDEATNIPLLDTQEVINQMPKDVIGIAKRAADAIASEDFQKEVNSQALPGADAEITTLGTGSALPSKYRNVSATLLRVPEAGTYLFDCGEDTYGQMLRAYSHEEAQEILRDLKVIWISHLHADHHIGTATLIKEWYKANKGQGTPKPSFWKQHPSVQNPLFVFAHSNMIDWLNEYSEVEDIGMADVVSLNVMGQTSRHATKLILNPGSKQMELSFRNSPQGVIDALKSGTGLEDFAATYVPHCHGAMAVSMTWPGGFKVSFSGDCRPSKDFVNIGQDSTVLIHEATFDDCLRGDAIAKKHSTTSEAIGVGLAMNARRILLTHFSQRYQKIPVMSNIKDVRLGLESADQDDDPTNGMDMGISEDNSSTTVKPEHDLSSTVERTISTKPRPDTKVAVSFDFMRVKVKDIASLEKFNPAFSKLYEEAFEDIKED